MPNASRMLPPEAVRATAAVRALNDTAATAGERPAAFVLTFGCQQNEADSEKMRGMAAERGCRITDHPDQAELS